MMSRFPLFIMSVLTQTVGLAHQLLSRSLIIIGGRDREKS